MAFVPSAHSVPTLLHGLSHIARGPQSSSRSLPSLSRASPCRRVATPTMMSVRKFLVGGNWKCNLTTASIADLVASLNQGPALDPSAIEVVVAPPAVYLQSTRDALRPDFATCAQNSWQSAGGAYTGELDPAMVSDVGASWLILGHSERRHLPDLKESDEFIATKAQYALENTSLSVIYCIGELLSERETGHTLDVCQRQLAALAAHVSDWSRVVIAYEPVWAIGTGKVATPEQAEEVHSSVRTWINDNVSPSVGDATRILYGGSVSPANCHELAKKPNVDGFLVGGASLKSTFLEIVDSYKVAFAGAV